MSAQFRSRILATPADMRACIENLWQDFSPRGGGPLGEYENFADDIVGLLKATQAPEHHALRSDIYNAQTKEHFHIKQVTDFLLGNAYHQIPRWGLSEGEDLSDLVHSIGNDVRLRGLIVEAIVETAQGILNYDLGISVGTEIDRCLPAMSKKILKLIEKTGDVPFTEAVTDAFRKRDWQSHYVPKSRRPPFDPTNSGKASDPYNID